MKSVLKQLLRLTPYRIRRASELNRFQAVEEALHALLKRGYAPRQVFDTGANVGHFSTMAARLWPAADFHLIEPQPACHPALNALCQSRGFNLYPVAAGNLSGFVALVVNPEGVTTGAHVTTAARPDAVTVPIVTLDTLLLNKIEPADRTLLKLDLQGFEKEALLGAKESLRSIEVVLCEVSFYTADNQPDASGIVALMSENQYGRILIKDGQIS